MTKCEHGCVKSNDSLQEKKIKYIQHMSQTKKIVTGMWSNNGLGHTAIQKLSD